MKKAAQYIFFLGFLGAGHVINAHELATHGALTAQAYQRSTLSTESTRLKDLGLDPANADPFGSVYYDVSGGQVRERLANVGFEGRIIGQLGVTPLSIPGWLMRGAIREDDLGFVFGLPIGRDPHDDPYGPFWRVMHHFYDPARNLPLTLSQSCAILFQLATGESAIFRRAPDWAVGSSDAFVQPNTPEVNRRNHFTIFDAREAIYRALTGRDSQGNPLQPAPGGTLTKQSDIRNAYWATTFRALGDVLHLNQDMAQPQHTRNDTHGGAPCFGHESTFEKYIEARATGALSFRIDGTQVTPQPLNYGGYPIPAFTKYSDFWSTREGISGRGLADYSNRGFFTFGTNLGSNPYASPSNDAGSYTRESTTGLLPTEPQQVLTFLKGDVPDTLNAGSTANIRMTTESVFDQFLAPTPPTYSLNRLNYDDMAKLLIPRAAAYSAGLINYFFRGKLDAVPQGPGTLLVKNLSAEEMKGDFGLYYDDSQGNRHPVAITTCRVGSVDVPVLQGKCSGATLASVSASPNTRLEVSFTPPAVPAPKTAGEYMLVFNGNMGNELRDEANGVPGAVVAKSIRPGYFMLGYKHVFQSGGEGTPVIPAHSEVRTYDRRMVAAGATDPMLPVAFSPFSRLVSGADGPGMQFEVDSVGGLGNELTFKTLPIDAKGTPGSAEFKSFSFTSGIFLNLNWRLTSGLTHLLSGPYSPDSASLRIIDADLAAGAAQFVTASHGHSSVMHMNQVPTPRRSASAKMYYTYGFVDDASVGAGIMTYENGALVMQDVAEMPDLVLLPNLRYRNHYGFLSVASSDDGSTWWGASAHKQNGSVSPDLNVYTADTYMDVYKNGALVDSIYMFTLPEFADGSLPLLRRFNVPVKTNSTGSAAILFSSAAGLPFIDGEEYQVDPNEFIDGDLIVYDGGGKTVLGTVNPSEEGGGVIRLGWINDAADMVVVWGTFNDVIDPSTRFHFFHKHNGVWSLAASSTPRSYAALQWANPQTGAVLIAGTLTITPSVDTTTGAVTLTETVHPPVGFPAPGVDFYFDVFLNQI